MTHNLDEGASKNQCNTYSGIGVHKLHSQLGTQNILVTNEEHLGHTHIINTWGEIAEFAILFKGLRTFIAKGNSNYYHTKPVSFLKEEQKKPFSRWTKMMSLVLSELRSALRAIEVRYVHLDNYFTTIARSARVNQRIKNEYTIA